MKAACIIISANLRMHSPRLPLGGWVAFGLAYGSVLTGFAIVSYAFETLLFLCFTLFASRDVCSKSPFDLALSGITNDDVDLSVDALKAVTLPLLKLFGVAEEGGLELKVLVEYTRLAISSTPWLFVSYFSFTACAGRNLGSASDVCLVSLVFVLLL